jgi:iron complex outermembrane receptor protein
LTGTLAAAAGLSLLAATTAAAAEPVRRLSIPSQAYADALIGLAVQANVSIVGVSACGSGRSQGLSGAYSLEAALSRLLAGAPCTFRIVDPQTVRIIAVATPRREPARSAPLVAELMVTAMKRPASLGRVPAAVSALPGDQIDLTSASEIGRTTGQLAGVLTTNLGPGRDKLLIRGLSDGAFTGRARSTVSTYLDDAPLNYNAPDPDLRLTDVDRVEVARGPQGALYGSGALSGVYRIVTRKPVLDVVEGGVSALTAWTKGGSASRALDGWINLPLAEGRLALRAAAYHDIQGGYLDNDRLQVSNVDRTSRNGGRLAVRAQVTDAWQVDLAAAGQRLRSNDTQYIAAGMGQQRSNGLREGHKNDFAEAALTVRGDLGLASLNSALAYVHHTYASEYDALAAASPSVFDQAGADLGLFYESARVNMLVQDVVLRSNGPGPFSWLVGAYGASTLQKTPATLDLRGPAGMATYYRENRHDRLRELALYGEAAWRFGDGWTIAAGARAFESRIRTLADVIVEQPGVSRTFDAQRRFSGVSPTISLQRDFGSDDLVYLLYSEGYRPGGFNTAGVYALRDSRVLFGSDRLRNYEAGAKLRLRDRRLSLRSAVFYDQWSNIQTDQYRPSGLSYTANMGDARILGLEAEASYAFDFGLSVQANGLLSTSEITRVNADFLRLAPTLIDDLPGAPGFSGGVLAHYERPLGALTLRLTGEASYVGRSSLSFNASQPARSGDFLRARLAAELAAERWSAAIFLANPLNQAGDTFAYGNPFTFSQTRQATPQRPRTLGARIAATF